jgi:uncharacterized protein YjbI with pentapeptide repeats
MNMIYPNENNNDKELSENHRELKASINTSHNNLSSDCGKCFGLCCVALYFSASEGFPTNKDAGKPCINLKSDFSCVVHMNLRKKGLKGCTAYDCFGAGQRVAQVTYSGHDWIQVPESAHEMFEVFLIMRQLHEMLWYLTEALTLPPARNIQEEISLILSETEQLTQLSADSLIALDVEAHRAKVNLLLQKTSELVRAKFRGGQKTPSGRKSSRSGRQDFIGKDLRKTNLRGADLRGINLSGADLIGADLRDTDLRGTNLIDAIFITQAQINTAKGDSDTKLPKSLVRPMYWSK